ncbi:MAG: FadR family transcriptional regulator [Bradyrhizobiaceae bacterium]|nr:FadR family transcriptional regulator [Bradyrhizobiaceae bacterium]
MSRTATKERAGEGSAIGPLTAPRSLTAELVRRLTADITAGKLAPGSRLPTEQEMIAATGVSRTVVREAVAALRAEGLVITRQGVGTIVADGAARPFRLDLDDERSLREVLEVAELRTGIEIEAAGLAAERATSEAIRRIGEALAAIEGAVKRGEDAIEQDFAFHRSIAEATNNPQFLRFLDFLGRFIIPRQTIRAEAGTAENRRAYLERLQQEHREIYQAIRAREVTRARAAMRKHLLNSRKRYRKLAEKLGRT